MEDQAVKRMHHDRDAGHPRRQAAEDAGLGGVRVHDVKAAAADEPGQIGERPQIGERLDGTDQVRGEDQVHAFLVRQRVQIPLGSVVDAGVEGDLVARILHLPEDGEERVLHGAADDQAGDDVQDPDRPAARGQRARIGAGTRDREWGLSECARGGESHDSPSARRLL